MSPVAKAIKVFIQATLQKKDCGMIIARFENGAFAILRASDEAEHETRAIKQLHNNRLEGNRELELRQFLDTEDGRFAIIRWPPRIGICMMVEPGDRTDAQDLALLKKAWIPITADCVHPQVVELFRV